MKQDTQNHLRIDVEALMKALPVSSLEPQRLAYIKGLVKSPEELEWQELVSLVEPPAGQHEPYVNPSNLLEKIYRHHGATMALAKGHATESLIKMQDVIPQKYWVTFFDFFSAEGPEHIPLPELIKWLKVTHMPLNKLDDSRQNGEGMQISSSIIDFLERLAEVAATSPLFNGPGSWGRKPWSLNETTEIPLPKAMVEYLPGPPLIEFEGDYETTKKEFYQWRDSIRPAALSLEKVLGEPVYYFKDLDEELDDDCAHRFLILHWCCTHKPDSAFVRFLLRVSGTKDLEALKAALLDPSSYTHPFVNNSFFGIDTIPFVAEYLPANVSKTIGVVFMTQASCEIAKSILAKQIGAKAIVIAPEELNIADWTNHATRHCRDWTWRNVIDGKLDQPLEILASIDELYFIANEPRLDCELDLKLSASAEELLALAVQSGIPTHHCRLTSAER